MSRSVWKGPFIDPSLLRKVKKVKTAGKREVIKTWSRRSTIIPDFVGMNFAVHNGKLFVPVFVVENMVGSKFGEYSPTRTFRSHSGDDKKGKK
jgi:small subunit ribosomal protein S19